jgi:molybdate transport system substrate-binding protein
MPRTSRSADDARALVTIGMRRVFESVIPAFRAATGKEFQVDYASTIEIAQRVVGGERADLVIASRAGIEKLISAHKVRPDDQFDLGGSRIVMAVPAGKILPDVSSVEAVKNALLAAKTVSYTDPASGGPSGIQMARVLARLGILEQVNTKARFPAAGRPVGDFLARAEADIGIQQSVELTSYPGVEVVGPLPAEMQIITTYVAAVPSDSHAPDIARSFVDFLRSPGGQLILKQSGLELP